MTESQKKATVATRIVEGKLEAMLLDATERRDKAIAHFGRLQRFLTETAGPAFMEAPSDYSRVQTYQNAIAQTAAASTICTYTQKVFEECHIAAGRFLQLQQQAHEKH